MKNGVLKYCQFQQINYHVSHNQPITLNSKVTQRRNLQESNEIYVQTQPSDDSSDCLSIQRLNGSVVWQVFVTQLIICDDRF